ncbi:MAG: peptidoglycan-binding protein [Leptolyngbyaceae cyanobacterium SM2_5_2]|nr:peptidoglycan-binding protein [Leptolyngbyaceae cyanobacterium SM2_5_2]
MQAVLANSPKLAGTMLKLAFSSPPALAQVVPADGAEAASPTSASPDATALRLGSEGEAVRVLQTRLQALGFYTSTIDGLFGPLTAEAVATFQQAERLQVDGVVGAETWSRLFGAGTLPVAARSPQRPAWASPQPKVEVARPIFSPAVVPQLSFHPIAVVPDESNPRVMLAVVLMVSSLGLAALGFKTERPSPTNPSAAAEQPAAASKPIPAPKPVYRQQTAAIHYPEPVYPHKLTVASESTAAVTLPGQIVAGDRLTVNSYASQPQPGMAEANTSEPLSVATETYLPSFLYDLFQPSSRYQLEAMVQGLADSHAAPEPPHLSALLQRVGVFPTHNSRTGHTYTYMLLDDVGGCFRLCDNELWVTHVASRWLQHDVPYTATIRRIDSAGRVVDKEFTVALSRYQLEMAS